MIIAIVGPTGIGKTALSISLAKHYNAEIINFDAMQVYEKMDIGTAKVTKEEMDELKTVATLGTPLQFIKGNGEYVGVFVISSIESSTEQTSSEGDILSIQVELKLLEYTGKIPEEKEQEGGLKTK